MADNKEIIKNEIIKNTEVTLWRVKNTKEVVYSITIACRGLTYITVSAMKKKNLNDMIAKFDSIIVWMKYMVDENSI